MLETLSQIKNSIADYKDGREYGNIVLLLICTASLMISNLLYLLASLMMVMKFNVLAYKIIEIANIFAVSGLIVLFTVMILDLILRYSENVERILYYPSFTRLIDNIKVLLLSILLLACLVKPKLTLG